MTVGHAVVIGGYGAVIPNGVLAVASAGVSRLVGGGVLMALTGR